MSLFLAMSVVVNVILGLTWMRSRHRIEGLTKVIWFLEERTEYWYQSYCSLREKGGGV